MTRQYKKRLVNATEPFFIFVKSDDYYFNPDGFMPIHALLKEKPQKFKNWSKNISNHSIIKARQGGRNGKRPKS